jgi:hypothetical protein
MRRWLTALIVLGMAGAGMIAAVPAAMAANPGCLVVDTNSDHSYPSLQAAVDAAAAGDTLFVKGTCASPATVITTSLTITGQSNGGTTTATLDFDVQLIIAPGVTVTLNKLVIAAGGINNDDGTVTLNHSIVTNTTNQPDHGGIVNGSGMMTLNDTNVTGINGNFGIGPPGAGAIANIDGTLILNGTSSVSGNSVLGAAGGGIGNFGGTLTLNGSSNVTGNTANFGGGIYNNFNGTVTLNDSSTITGNTATATGGGGIFNDGTVTLNDSSTITGNTADPPGDGGGICNRFGTLNGAVPGTGGNVFGNTPDDIVSSVSAC